jgi:hypothetical protein
VVEPVDVLGDGDLDVADGLPTAVGAHDRVADALGLEQRVNASAIALTPLQVKISRASALLGCLGALACAVVDHDGLVDLAGQEALQAADDVSLRQAFGGATAT